MKKLIEAKVSTTVERFSPPITSGLDDAQVSQRISQGLDNKSGTKYSKSVFAILLGNFCSFFNLLGLIVCVALICVKAPLPNFFFVLIYIANIFIGIVQELRAKSCIEKLSLLSKSQTTVIRNGHTEQIDSSQIVLDDLIILKIGNQVPTDCLIIDGEVEVNESLLTGESVAVKKKPGEMLFAGSFITSGTITCKADKVGKDNYVETLSAKAKKYKKPQSELMGSLRFIIKIIGLIIVPIATLFILKSIFLTKTNLSVAINTTSAVVIGLIPSGMFLLTSMALAVGVIKLARHNTLVQDLYSLEMLARVDTICFDKTGTITDGKMSVNSIVDISCPQDQTKEIMRGMLANLKDSNQTACALINYFGKESKLYASQVIPFSSKRKLSAVTFQNGPTYAFGAPEFVLSKAELAKIEFKINNFTSQGLRVLVLAQSNVAISAQTIPNDFIPLSLIVLADNIREDAIETINWFKENNVAIKVISGDNPITVAEVSKRVGIEGADKYISLEGLSDQEVYDLANEYTVFGRVTPEQKAILVKSMKDNGHVTAMTGDGVNDILALKEADCAVSVAAGSDAARNISHLVLMDNNFNSMPKVVYEGRRVINNVQSSSTLFLMKTLFTLVFALITLFDPTKQNYPFVLANMILLEVFVIGLPSFFLSLQENDALVEGNFISTVFAKSLPSAILMVFSVLLVYLFEYCFGSSNNVAIYTNMKVFALTYAGLISLYFICKPLNIYRSILFGANASVILAATLIAVFFGFSMLQLETMMPITKFWPHLLTILGIILIDIPLMILLQKACKNIKFNPKKKKV